MTQEEKKKEEEQKLRWKITDAIEDEGLLTRTKVIRVNDLIDELVSKALQERESKPSCVCECHKCKNCVNKKP